LAAVNVVGRMGVISATATSPRAMPQLPIAQAEI